MTSSLNRSMAVRWRRLAGSGHLLPLMIVAVLILGACGTADVERNGAAVPGIDGVSDLDVLALVGPPVEPETIEFGFVTPASGSRDLVPAPSDSWILVVMTFGDDVSSSDLVGDGQVLSSVGLLPEWAPQSLHDAADLDGGALSVDAVRDPSGWGVSTIETVPGLSGYVLVMLEADAFSSS